jgi:hypothetical protein
MSCGVPPCPLDGVPDAGVRFFFAGDFLLDDFAAVFFAAFLAVFFAVFLVAFLVFLLATFFADLRVFFATT